MKIVVFGAGRGVGRAAVEAALAAGHEVTAFVRRPASWPASDRLRSVTGDAMDPAAVDAAVAGQDAAIDSLGARGNVLAERLGLGGARAASRICSEGTRLILASMATHRVRRLVVVSAYGLGATRAGRFLSLSVLYTLVIPHRIADKERMEAAVRAAGVEHVLLHPVFLTDGPAAGDYLATTDGARGATRISRADVGAAAVRALSEPAWLGQTVSLSDRPHV